MNWSIIIKSVLIYIGAALGYLCPTLPFIAVVTVFVFLDCWSAWRLSKRVSKKYPHRATGKFKSGSVMKVFFHTLPFIYFCIIGAYFADQILVPDKQVYMANIVAGGFCFAQFWSILENEACLNNKPWARILQKIVVSKVERHFDLQIEDDLEAIRKEVREQIEKEYGITKKSRKNKSKSNGNDQV